MSAVRFLTKDRVIERSADLVNVTKDAGGTITARAVNSDNANVPILFGTGNAKLVETIENKALPASTTHLSGDVPTSRTVNNKALTENINLTAEDVGALGEDDTAADSSKLGGVVAEKFLNKDLFVNVSAPGSSMAEMKAWAAQITNLLKGLSAALLAMISLVAFGGGKTYDGGDLVKTNTLEVIDMANTTVKDVVGFADSASYSWSRPNEWMVGLAYSSISASGETTLVTTNNFDMVFWQRSVITNFYAYADATAKVVDENSISPAPAVTWASLDSRCSVTAAGRVTATTNGLYRISATTAEGEVRYADVAINNSYAIISRGQLVYSADANQRKVINDAAMTVLNDATNVGTGTYGGKSYIIWNTFTPKMSGTGAGNVRCWAVSPHILASAKHYSVKPLGQQTFSDGTTSATVTKRAWINLADWAVTNGWTQTEIAAMHIGDIDLIVCDTATAVPDGCIPYFVGSTKWKQMCGGFANGVVAWCANQTYQYAQPLILNQSSWDWEIVPQDQKFTTVRADILTRLTAMGYACPIHSGDSGHPVFVMYNGNPVIVSQFTTTDNGPNYVAGFEVLKAFVEAHGDSIKEVQ